MSEELKPCPFCGGTPDLPSGDGTHYVIECGKCGWAVVGVQISDLMTIEERRGDPFTNYRYAEQYIERAKAEAIKQWNTRATPPAAQVQGEQPVVVGVRYEDGTILSAEECGSALEVCAKVQTPLMTVAQHERIVAGLQGEVSNLKNLLRYFDEHGATQAWVMRYKQALEGAALSAPPAAGVPEGWNPMDTAPKDGTLLRLLVNFDDHAIDDGAGPFATVGTNYRDNTGEDAWQIVGWCWEQDRFIDGVGTPVGWLPMLSTPPASEQQQAVVLPKIDGTALVEVVNGAEGPSLYIGNEDGGYRLAGPKPWGGGRTIHKFTVKLDELVREAMDLAGVNQGVTTEAGNGGDV